MQYSQKSSLENISNYIQKVYVSIWIQIETEITGFGKKLVKFLSFKFTDSDTIIYLNPLKMSLSAHFQAKMNFSPSFIIFKL